MTQQNPCRSLHLGMRADELDRKPYARFWNPRMKALPLHAFEAICQGPVAPPMLPDLASSSSWLDAGYREVENGFTQLADGAVHVAVLTEMPNVTPDMIDWWFGWHSAEPQRYKLWHPQAHVHARWRQPDPPGPTGRARYVGRTSLVDEYVGNTLSHVAIRFVLPTSLGFDEPRLAEGEATTVCARIGFVDQPIEIGFLAHQVRRVAGGSEMRSRFWLGGQNGGLRTSARLGDLASRVVRQFKRPDLSLGQELLAHCSKEMTHLASFLPELYTEMRDVH